MPRSFIRRTPLAIFTACSFHFTTAMTLQSAPPPPPTHANAAYGTHARQVLDFWKAPGAATPTPVLFFIHGGGWMNGDKANPDFLVPCLEGGISVVTINYRLIPDVMPPGGGVPAVPPVKACLDDSARALQFVRSKAAEWGIDKTRIAGSGGSAGGFNVLWLAFHDDMADAKSSDLVARESTRLTCALTFVPQTSLDPKQMREWIANTDYGHHAFALPSYQAFLDQRERLMPWIKQFSPYELVSADDPPVLLFYDSVPAMGQPHKDPPHSANFGAGLAEKLRTTGLEFELNVPGAQGLKYPDLMSFLKKNLE